jgi:hypothetical protein
VPGYTEIILTALLKHSSYPNAAQLAVLFVEATKPVLDTPEKMALYMEALIRTDLDAAFRYQVTPFYACTDRSALLLNRFENNYLHH